MYRVEVSGQYKGDVFKKSGASPWCWQRIATRLDGTIDLRGRDTFRKLSDIKPWIARICRVDPADVRFIPV